MDDVPVKISEKFKPPPKVSIPQTIVNRLNSDGYPIGIFDYNFTLEKNVIKKIEEWKRVRDMEKVNRQSRLRELEIKQARELEEKQKQLLTTVSYPNADEISSGDEGESDSSTIVNSTAPTTITPINTCNTPEKLNQAFNQQNFNTILKPTVLPETTMNNIMTNQTSIWKNNLSTNLKSNIGNKINYSDFENDTSSPFDNVELKTINDMDILAQVYNMPHSNNKDNSIKEINVNNTIDNIKLDSTVNNQIENENSTIKCFKTDNSNISIIRDSVSPTYWKNNNSNTIIQNNITMQSSGQNFQLPNTSINHYYQLQQNYANMNGSLSNPQQQQQQQQQQQFLINTDNYYGSSYGNVPTNQNYQYANFIPNNTKDSIANSTGYTNYLNYNNQQNYNTYTTTSYQPPPTVTCSSPTITYGNLNQYRSQNIDQKIASNVPYTNYVQRTDDTLFASNVTIKNLQLEESAIQSIKNKSKSVPDILKELDDEIRDSENRRARNHSQTLEDHSAKCKKQIETKHNKLPESFLKLSPSSQKLIKNISSMGFPFERVAKIAEKLGTDDKKIVEHLIPLSELLDLGFDEEKISEALLKFNNNKEKALDYLIS